MLLLQYHFHGYCNCCSVTALPNISFQVKTECFVQLVNLFDVTCCFLILVIISVDFYNTMSLLWHFRRTLVCKLYSVIILFVLIHWKAWGIEPFNNGGRPGELPHCSSNTDRCQKTDWQKWWRSKDTPYLLWVAESQLEPVPWLQLKMDLIKLVPKTPHKTAANKRIWKYNLGETVKLRMQ